jgi:hypothetical protein
MIKVSKHKTELVFHLFDILKQAIVSTGSIPVIKHIIFKAPLSSIHTGFLYKAS